MKTAREIARYIVEQAKRTEASDVYDVLCMEFERPLVFIMADSIREFRVGDKVRAFGVEGVICEIRNHSTFPVMVQFYPQEANPCESFTLDGKLFDWHREPSLRHVEEPTPRKRQVKMWQALYRTKDSKKHYISRAVYPEGGGSTEYKGELFIRLLTEYPPVIVEVGE